MKHKYLYIILIGILAVLITYLSLLIYDSDDKIIILSNIDTDNEIITACSNLTLSDTAVCLNKNIKTFFIYNYTNLGKDLTFEELKEQGGVCSHWSALYINLAERLGYEGKQIVFVPKDKEIGHSFAIIYDKENYCTLEQDTDPVCYIMSYE